MNNELIKGLYSTFSPSRKEKPMRKFLKKYMKKIPNVSFKTDKAGNILVTKGEAESYPCICAHMDQVAHHTHPGDFKVYSDGKNIFGFSLEKHQQCGIGGDDKNGLYIALECLAKYDTLKCAFFVGEEIGCIGSSDVNLSFFDDCRFCLQIDRRGNSDLVTEIGGELCSKEFIDDVDCEKWGYKISTGAMTDVDTLKSRGLKISCVNMSCGYHKPHTDDEYTNIADLEKCQRFVEHIIEDCTKVYPHDGYERMSYGYNIKWDDWYGYDMRKLSRTPSSDEEYQEDKMQMEYILGDDPFLMFDDVLEFYGTFFYSTEEVLKEIYDEVMETIYGATEEN